VCVGPDDWPKVVDGAAVTAGKGGGSDLAASGRGRGHGHALSVGASHIMVAMHARSDEQASHGAVWVDLPQETPLAVTAGNES
jgi:hypothetical protein